MTTLGVIDASPMADMVVASLSSPLLAWLPLGATVAVSAAWVMANAVSVEPQASSLLSLAASSYSYVLPTPPLPASRGDLENLPPFMLEGSDGEEMEAEEWHLIETTADRADRTLESVERFLHNFGEEVLIVRLSMTRDIISHSQVGAPPCPFLLCLGSSCHG
jgi:hypothetical protein